MNATPPDLAALLEHLQATGVATVVHFRGDDLGWTGGELVAGGFSVAVERYLVKEDDLRDDLNTWAGWLETRADEPRHGDLMRHVIATQQLVTLKAPEPTRFCDEICRWISRQAEAVYQVDGRGFFSADGTMLLPEEPS